MLVCAKELEEDDSVRVCVSLVELYALAINRENHHHEGRGQGRSKGEVRCAGVANKEE
jgi:hypothetical protein